MKANDLKNIITMFSIFVCFGDSTPDTRCNNGTFKLTLLGRKQTDDQWNTTYDLKGSTCKMTKNWNLVLYQNITEEGDMQHIHLHGYFVDNGNSTQINGSQLIPFDSIRKGSLAISESNVAASTCFTGPTVEPKLKIVSRFDWNAQSPSTTLPRLVSPVKNVYLVRYAPKCTTLEECISWMQNEQRNNIPSIKDIRYNFYVGGDGRIYEGLGWDRERDSDLNLVFIADDNAISQSQFRSMAKLIREGYRLGKIDSEYKTKGNFWTETKKFLLSLID